MMDWVNGASRNADQRLQEALEALEAGASLEEVIAGLPERDRAELAGLLHLAMALRAMPHPEPTAASLSRDINRLVAEAKETPISPFPDHHHRREPLTLRRLLREVYLVGFAILMLAVFFCALSGNRPRLTGLGRPAFAPTHTPTPTPDLYAPPSATPHPQPLFSLASETPIITFGAPGDWNERYVTPAGAVYFDGVFHLFVNGSGVWPGPASIAHFTSLDGRTWTMQGSELAFSAADAPDAFTLLASDVAVQPDGMWVMSLTIYKAEDPANRVAIGAATAPGPDGPWTLADETLLERGSSPWTWDGLGVRHASLLYDESALLMFYTGLDSQQRQRVGLASSVGAEPPAKYDLADTRIAELSESDPVLVVGDPGDWDNAQVMQPSVARYGDGYLMLYRGVQEGTTRSGLGLALAESPERWTRYPGNPVLTPEQIPGARHVYEAELLVVGNAIYVFVAADAGDAHTAIYLVVYEGPLP